ncbi:hypothetical protein BKA66DRAFT_434045 [Pyrenochaeta sp. MPI-SDFR-AT-0127]|nr:hypothetical protein BKA66DRAFT_434045 [Pyrenochaeta sp. MPI-SDFR-AT-0127]
MDWENGNACLSDNASDLRRIFKYESRPSRVIKIVRGNNYRGQVWSLDSHEGWIRWLEKVNRSIALSKFWLR